MSAKNILAFGLKVYHTVEQYRKSLLRFFMLSYVLLTVAAIYWLRPRYIGKRFCIFAEHRVSSMISILLKNNEFIIFSRKI